MYQTSLGLHESGSLIASNESSSLDINWESKKVAEYDKRFGLKSIMMYQAKAPRVMDAISSYGGGNRWKTNAFHIHTHTYTHTYTQAYTLQLHAPLTFCLHPFYPMPLWSVQSSCIIIIFPLWNDLFPSLVVVWVKFWIHVHVQAYQVVTFYFLFFYLPYLFFIEKLRVECIFLYWNIELRIFIDIIF